MHWVNVAVPMMLLGSPAEREGDVQLSTSDGTLVQLSDLRSSRPALVVYEDRDSTALNQALKDALAAPERRDLLGKVSVVAIANVAAYDWFPARNFVISSVKSTEKALGVPLYLDWKGAMTSSTWALSAKGSTVVVLDRAGTAKLSKRGKLEPREVDEVLRLLTELSAAK